VLQGPILTTGYQVEEFERRFSAYLGCRDTVACTSWTAAAHITLVALGIGPGDEVITSPLTFVATATAIIQAGAVPVFVDCERTTGNLDATKIEKAISRKTKAIMPVHLYGRMCDMVAIHRIAKKHHLRLIEDAAHCIEGRRSGVRPGQLSDAACFSFFATKNLACGEGGAVSFNGKELSVILRRLRLHGITKTSADREREGYSHWDMPKFGWKYNMDNIHGAILLAQLKKFPANIKKRQKAAQYYQNLLKQITRIKILKNKKGEFHAHHLMPIFVPEKIRDATINHLKKIGIYTTINYTPVHWLSFFKKQDRYKSQSFPNAEKLGKEEISLPFYPNINRKTIRFICDRLMSILGNI